MDIVTLNAPNIAEVVANVNGSAGVADRGVKECADERVIAFQVTPIQIEGVKLSHNNKLREVKLSRNRLEIEGE